MQTPEPPDRVRLVGEEGLLIEVAGDHERVLRLTNWLRRQPHASRLREIVPAARTVFVVGPPDVLQDLASAVPHALLPAQTPDHERVVVIPVRYDGMDLPAAAERTGLRVRELIRLHTEGEYRVDFFGFAPGFAYLSGLAKSLRLPRRKDPRIRVPAGAVAIANEYTAIYPSDSPGGWHLIGTRLGPPLWDCRAANPSGISIGDRVVFREEL